MKKILIIGNTNIYGGVGQIIKEYCTRLYSEEIYFEFLYYEDFEKEEKVYFNKINAKYYTVPRYSKNPIRFFKSMKKFCRNNSYDVIHCHASTAMLIIYAIPMYILKKTPIIYQSHGCYLRFPFFHLLMRNIVKKVSVKYIAVSNEAGIWMFGKKGIKSNKYVLLKNGIDSKRYLYDIELRNAVRKKMGIENKYVIGHIGRFEVIKNHDFILEVFEKMYERNQNIVLLLVGRGKLENDIKNKIIKKGLLGAVLFAEVSEDVNKYYNAMDVFFFPSKSESLGLVVVEAQISGLPVVVSDGIPIETRISKEYYQLSLDAPKEVWGEIIMKAHKGSRENIKDEEFGKTGYTIESVISQLKNIYENV